MYQSNTFGPSGWDQNVVTVLANHVLAFEQLSVLCSVCGEIESMRVSRSVEHFKMQNCLTVRRRFRLRRTAENLNIAPARVHRAITHLRNDKGRHTYPRSGWCEPSDKCLRVVKLSTESNPREKPSRHSSGYELQSSSMALAIRKVKFWPTQAFHPLGQY